MDINKQVTTRQCKVGQIVVKDAAAEQEQENVSCSGHVKVNRGNIKLLKQSDAHFINLLL